MRQQLTHSPVRQIGLREIAFLRGEPAGDFQPMPCYAHGPYCECNACLCAHADNFEAADLPFAPDWSHTPTVGSERPQDEFNDELPPICPELKGLLIFLAVLGVIAVVSERLR